MIRGARMATVSIPIVACPAPVTLPRPSSPTLSFATVSSFPSTLSLPSLDLPRFSLDASLPRVILPPARTFDTVTQVDGALRLGDVNVFVIQSGAVDHIGTIMLMPQRLVLEIAGFTGHGRDFSIFRTIFLPGFRRHGFRQPPFLLIPHFVGFPLPIARDLRLDLIWDKSLAFFPHVCSSFQLQVRVDVNTLMSPLEGSSGRFDPEDRWYQVPLVDELPEEEFEDLMLKSWVRAFQDVGGLLSLESGDYLERPGSDCSTLVEETRWDEM